MEEEMNLDELNYLYSLSVELLDESGACDPDDQHFVNQIVGAFYRTPSGQEFEKSFLSQANIRKVMAAVFLISPWVNLASLEQAYKTLRANEAFGPRDVTQAEIEQDRKAKYESDTLTWFQKATTAEIRKRVDSGDFGFKNWLDKNRYTAVAIDAQSEEQLPKIFDHKTGQWVTAPAGLHPDQYVQIRTETRQQALRDNAYKEVPEELRQWVREYNAATALQVKAKMANPSWRSKMEEAARYGLI
jgi:hypothetical protein